MPTRRHAATGIWMLSFLVLAPVLTRSAVHAANPPVFHWVTDAEHETADLLLGDEPVLRYVYPTFDMSTPERAEETTKAFHHVFGPGTGTLITKGPGGLYPHHRGLFVGWSKTRFGGESIDFWHCRPGSGVHQQHAEFVDLSGDERSGRITTRIDWNDEHGKPVISETRSVRVAKAPADSGDSHGWQIDWSSELRSLRGEIVLDGDRQHAGFQYRAAQSVAESNGARYIRPSGFPQQPEAFEVNDRDEPMKHVDLGWLAMTHEMDGTRYTVEYFEDPSLPKPSRFSERPYGRFGAFFQTVLTQDKPLTMRYRLLISTGPAPTPSRIQHRYESFVAELSSDSPREDADE